MVVMLLQCPSSCDDALLLCPPFPSRRCFVVATPSQIESMNAEIVALTIQNDNLVEENSLLKAEKESEVQGMVLCCCFRLCSTVMLEWRLCEREETLDL